MVRTRMAPSPTGEYHIGHIRTLLFNYALAKKYNGQFVMRIEDTDRTRFVEGATERILQVIHDYGLDWDEGPEVEGPFGPYVQSQRLEVYVRHAEQLVDDGHAYYCFCTPEELKQSRADQQAQGLQPRYDRRCRELDIREARERVASDESYVVRLKVPDDENITFEDYALGEITFSSNDIDDQVLLKSDGFPTYHLAVVVDDHLMKITHIMRGSDWVSSTPKHVLLYRYFGWDFPIHAHLPNLKDVGEGKKLSKRFGATSAREFLNEGYLPEALLNFLMFLGWNPGTDKELYDLDEFIEDFSLEKLQTTDMVSFDRDKLLWYNGQYIRSLSDHALAERLKAFNSIHTKQPQEYLELVISLVKERMQTLQEFEAITSYFWKDPTVSLTDIVQKDKTDTETQAILKIIVDTLQDVSGSAWYTENLEEVLRGVQKESDDWSPKQLFMTIRLALSGQKATPPLFDMLAALGKDLVLKRLSLLT